MRACVRGEKGKRTTGEKCGRRRKKDNGWGYQTGTKTHMYMCTHVYTCTQTYLD